MGRLNMTTEERKEKEPIDFTVTAFGEVIDVYKASAFFDAKVKRKECPVCGESHRQAMIAGGADETAMTIITRRAVKTDESNYTNFKDPKGGRELPIVALWCPDCGYMQVHTMGTVAGWLKEQREADASTEGSDSEQE
ncbi:TPA: hypothetical protein ACOEPM_000317 [Stenotrophomonas maltophilia]